ncbi:CP family cyanate transporter-like MFS transporter [Paenibacillus rhizosphaerae]|uniref:CP family cyanate transporter-like MFS transporter n=1 Tax=Paenibacillus rhizosphaerae TaxID=297318 RepID=A0A839TU70_9BACL|nr:MFS transporter [Paenibacillus rhizosphaerae]MBB3128968.1 CP family cyanate transporter-like MFS transporter [Paenibacillus rhizosphaerae]
MRKPSLFMMAVAFILASLNLRPAMNSISPMLQAIQRDLGMSALSASLLTSIPVLCMGIFPAFAVKLGQRAGLERVIGWSIAVIGAGTVLRWFTGSSVYLLLTTVLAGLGIAAAGPLLSGFIKQHFPAKVPVMISLYTVSMAVGAALASGLSLPLSVRAHSWQESLALWAILAAVALPVWWWSVVRHTRRPAGEARSNRPAGLPWNSAKAWILTLSFGLLAVLFFSVTAWLPPVVEHMGYGKAYAANMLVLFSLTQIPVGLLFPHLLRRLPSRRFWLALGALSMAAGFLMLWMSVAPWLAAILIGIGPGVLFPVNLMMPIEAVSDAQQATSWSAMTQSVGYVIGAMGPMLLGVIHDAAGSYTLLIPVLLAVTVAMAGVQQLAAKPKAAKVLNKPREKEKALPLAE